MTGIKGIGNAFDPPNTPPDHYAFLNMPMSFDNQIEIPSSFIAMYLIPSRDRLNAPYEVILARYELCEDMACMLVEHAQKLAFDEDMQQKVLRQCHEGLLADPSNLSAQESMWVMHRLAELLDWAPLDFDVGFDELSPNGIKT